MKSYNHLYEQLYTDENLIMALHKSSRGKKHKHDEVLWCLSNEDHVVRRLQDMFANEAYDFPIHTRKLICDGISQKQRLIVIPRYWPEQVIHHAVIQVLEPVFTKGMYQYSCGAVPKRGGLYGKKYLDKYIRCHQKDCKYVLKMDVHHFFPSVSHEVLKGMFARVIHDPKMIRLLDAIIDVYEDTPGKGIPIGFYTSQWFANWYLQGLDHYIKEDLQAKCYVRYMDDMVILGPNKRELHRMKDSIATYTREVLKMELKDDWQVFRFDYKDEGGNEKGRDIDFMGFRFFRNRTTIRKSILMKGLRKANKIAKEEGHPNARESMQMLSYLSWFTHTDSYGYYSKYIKDKINVRRMKRTISKWSRRRIEHDHLQEGRKSRCTSRGGCGVQSEHDFRKAQYQNGRKDSDRRNRSDGL